MTNHPRRVGRRKQQRHSERAAAAAADLQAELRRQGLLRLPGWTDLTDLINGVSLGNGKPWTPSYVGAAPADRQHLTHVHRWPNGRIDTVRIPTPPQQQLKGSM